MALGDVEPVGFSWIVVLAFLRLSTRVGLVPEPLPVEQAVGLVEDWFGRPPAVVIEPTSRHLAVLSGLLKETGSGGNSSATPTSLRSRSSMAPPSSPTTTTSRFTGVDWRYPSV